MFKLDKLSTKLTRYLLLIAACCQLLLSMAASAAMQTAQQGSPFYCGKLSAPMLSQLRGMDLPAELLRQALPDGQTKHCKACVVANTDDLLPAATLAPPAIIHPAVAYVRAPVSSLSIFPPQYFQARAPPQ